MAKLARDGLPPRIIRRRRPPKIMIGDLRFSSFRVIYAENLMSVQFYNVNVMSPLPPSPPLVHAHLTQACQLPQRELGDTLVVTLS